MRFQKQNVFLSRKNSEAGRAGLPTSGIQEHGLPPTYCSAIPQDIVFNCLIEVESVAYLGSGQQKGRECGRACAQCLKPQTLLLVPCHWPYLVTWPSLTAKESEKLGLAGHCVPEKEHIKHLE